MKTLTSHMCRKGTLNLVEYLDGTHIRFKIFGQIAKKPDFFHANNKDADQTNQNSLISVFGIQFLESLIVLFDGLCTYNWAG